MVEVLNFFQQGMWMVIVLSAPPLFVATLFGVLVSLIQAITQIQDQTLSYIVKLFSVSCTLAAIGRWLGGQLIQLTDVAFTLIPAIGR